MKQPGGIRNCVNANELTSPNSGIVVIGTSYKESYGNYYGRVEEVLKLFYHNGHQVIVFKYHWLELPDVRKYLDNCDNHTSQRLQDLNPHYFSQRTWNSICDHWGTPQFAMRSELGQNARLKLEFTSRTGAIPYEQRREEIDEEREEKGEMSITDEEFLTRVYDPNNLAVKDLQLRTDQPPSPRTQMEINQKKDVIATMQARPPKKGRIILHPQDTVGELIGAQ
ncbi:hypothetical protein POM88_044201 [Heracleum sosnowskyi]|uniref:Uncharacterized protein n=1 Tax=Heracleum sosnowskyi TaxID=360622 RepID=A0AAD8H4Z4_9APIA|nr:hypothetical protein POM88_044201 [Heracleum sosnowskyi]